MRRQREVIGMPYIIRSRGRFTNSVYSWNAATKALPFGSTFTRSSNGTYFDSTGTLQVASSDTPRFDYNPITLEYMGLLLEGQRTNSIPNNTMQGATASSLPTGWTSSGATSGISINVTGTGTENGMPYIDIRLSGTASAASGIAVNMAGNTTIAATNNQNWVLSSFICVQAGDASSLDYIRHVMSVRDSGGSGLTLVYGAQLKSAIIAGTVCTRHSDVVVTNSASTAYAVPRIECTWLNGSVIDVTLRIKVPQFEVGGFATSVILTSGSAATRSTEFTTVNSQSMGYNSNEGTLFVEIGRAITETSGQEIIARFQNNGSVTDQIVLVKEIGGSNFRVGVQVSSGSTAYSGYQGFGSVRFAIGYKPNDSAFYYSNGVTGSWTSPSSIPSNVQILRLGSDTSGGTHFYGWLRSLKYWPIRLQNSALSGLVV